MWCHNNDVVFIKNIGVCTQLNYIQNLYLGFFIFWKLTELCHFVNYLWNNPRILSLWSPFCVIKFTTCVWWVRCWLQCQADCKRESLTDASVLYGIHRNTCSLLWLGLQFWHFLADAGSYMGMCWTAGATCVQTCLRGNVRDCWDWWYRPWKHGVKTLALGLLHSLIIHKKKQNVGIITRF